MIWLILLAIAFIYVFLPFAVVFLFRVPEIASLCSNIFASTPGTIVAAATLTMIMMNNVNMIGKQVGWQAKVLLTFALVLALFRYLMDSSSYILWDISQIKQQEPFPLSGKVAIVTGANKGIGFEAAKLLAADLGAHVVLTCRTISRCRDVVAAVNDAAQTSQSGGSARSMALELSSLESAKDLVEALNTDAVIRETGIHVLFNHAGMSPTEHLTKEGLEDGFGGMYLAHMALTLGILPLLEKGAMMSSAHHRGPSRVVITSSEALLFAAQNVFGDAFHSSLFEGDGEGDLRGERTLARKEPATMQAYSRAKLASTLFCFELNRRLQAKYRELPSPLVIVHTLHPGPVLTTSSCAGVSNMLESIPGMGWMITRIMMPLLWRSPRSAARILLYAGLSNDPSVMTRGGAYINSMGHPVVSSLDHVTTSAQYDAVLQADEKYSQRLWEVSVRLIAQSPASAVVQNAP